jgi:hypothetical protein
MSAEMVARPRRDSDSRARRHLDFALTYTEVARALVATGTTGQHVEPLYMLMAHAMELALKAVVARRRCDNERLILLGHDLRLCLDAATREGLELAPDDPILDVIDALAMPHLAQALRYPAYMSWPLPNPQTVLDALDDLLPRVRDRVVASPRP